MMGRKRFIVQRGGTETIGSFWRANSQGRLEQMEGAV
jgi:hypothetical protein